MPLHCFFKASFNKALDKLPSPHQELVFKTLTAIDHYFKTGTAPFGLRIKKLYTSAMGKTFEARVSVDLRIVWVQTNQEVVFALLGTHDDVRRFLREL